MLEEITQILRKTTPLKARELAKKLGVEKKDVNAFLHRHKDHFEKDENFLWSLKEIEICFPKGWVTARIFEEKLHEAGCLLMAPVSRFRFVFPKKCYLMLEASSRILALANQLADSGNNVELDFSQSTGTVGYLDRSGFLAHLHQDIQVLPDVSRRNRLQKYLNQSDGLFEVRSIDPADPDTNIPIELKDKFVLQTDKSFTDAAFTVFSELFQNVIDHSKTPKKGFAALQAYGGRKHHIQTVVSDNGIGIYGSLAPILPKMYPEIANQYNSLDADVGWKLTKKVLEEGEISSRKRGDGMGLNRSWGFGKKLNATVSVRQDNFELCWSFEDGDVSDFSSYENLPLIRGTHICFDFEY